MHIQFLNKKIKMFDEMACCEQGHGYRGFSKGARDKGVEVLDDSQNQLMLTLIPCMWPQIKQVLTRNEVVLMWLKMMFTKICLHN